MTPPKVCVVVLHWNNEEDTRACLASLQACTYENLTVILVDNASSDHSGERLHQQFPSVVYVHNERNRGFAGGNNAGIAVALQRGARFVLLLNNDTLVDPGFVQPLVELAETENSVGAIGCKIFLHTGDNILWYAGGVFHFPTGTPRHRGMHEPDIGQYDKIEETDFVTGCMMFLRREAIEQVGFLDESFFAYFEDADWCFRARKAGWRIIYNPQSRIWHKVSASSKIDSPFYLYLTMRNKIMMVRRHSTFSKTFFFFPYFFYFYARQFGRLAVRWRSWEGTKAVWYGLADGLRNFTGEDGKGRLELIVRKPI